MKNRYLRGAHLSEKKVRELIRLFADDLNATQIAEISGISRITANAYLKMFRKTISQYCDEKNPVKISKENQQHLAEEYRQLFHNSRDKKPLFGLFAQDGFVIALPLNGEKKDPETGPSKSFRHHGSDGSSPLVAIADLNKLQLHKTPVAQLNGHAVKYNEDIETFWTLMKSRLVKFRGLNNTTLILHVKETEFRFNCRDQDLYELLLNLIFRKPLHTVKDYNSQQLN